MISTLVRGSTHNPQNVDPNEPKIGAYVYFNDVEIQISSKEKELIQHLNANELLLRMLTGQLDSWLKALMRKEQKAQPQRSRFTESVKDPKLDSRLEVMGPPKPIKVPRSKQTPELS